MAFFAIDRNRMKYWVVVSIIFYFHPYLGKWSHLTNIFERGWNHQLEQVHHDVQVQQHPHGYMYHC